VHLSVFRSGLRALWGEIYPRLSRGDPDGCREQPSEPGRKVSSAVFPSSTTPLASRGINASGDAIEAKCHEGLQKRQSQDTLRSIGGGNVGAMDVKGRELGPGDAEAVLDLPSLNELAEIDRDRYTIVGIDLRVDGPTTVIPTVYAIDRLEDSVLSIRLRDRPTLRSWATAAVRFL
jgi:hypothetical protein